MTDSSMTANGVQAPKVSVVMSVYNGSENLSATVDSILHQTFSDFEFIVVDDGSTDSTAAILDDYAAQDSRIVVVKQDNAGLTSALNSGCSLAKGEYIARQDVGDQSRPERFEKQLCYLEQHPDVVAIGSGHVRVGPGGEFLGEAIRNLSPEEITRVFLERGESISHTVAMFRRDAFIKSGGYRTEFRFAQDVDLWYRMSTLGNFAEVPEVLFEWGIDLDGLSSSNRGRQQKLAELAFESYQLITSGNDDREILEKAKQCSWNTDPGIKTAKNRYSVADANFFIGSQLFSLGDRRCRSYFLRVVALRPWRLPTWIKLLLSYLP